MSKRTSHQVDLQISKVGRRHQARRSHAIFEALEKRRLLSGYTGYTFTLAAQPGTNQAAINLANGTYLQALINGTSTITGDGVTNHTVTLGDTLILPDTYDYDMGPTHVLELPDLGAAATLSSANVSSGQLTGSLTMTFDGGGYNSVPTVEFFGGSGTGAAATVTMGTTTNSGCNVASITVSGGSGYSATALPTIAIVGGGLGTLTIESSGYNAGDLGSGRFNSASDVPYDAQITGGFVNGIVATELSDSHGHSGAAQNYSFDGIEICPDADTDNFQAAFFVIGSSGSNQAYDQLVPYNFTFNQDYIHGGMIGETTDDLSTGKLEADDRAGVQMEANYVTVENSQLSDITEPLSNTVQDQCLVGNNMLGNFVINNNYLEAAGENIIFGGAENYLPEPAQANNLTITNNFFTKNPAWNPNLPQFAGVPVGVCNLLEFKTGANATISHNVFQNVWLSEDSQRGEALDIDNIDSHSNNKDVWYDVANDTITDNVFRNLGAILDLGAGTGDTTNFGPSENEGNTELTNNITIENNLAYDLGGWQWGTGSLEWAMTLSSSLGGPMQNVTIENNTIIGTNGIIYLQGPPGLTTPVVANLVCENNVLDESELGVDSTPGQDNYALNSVELAALTITNPGSGYTYSTNGFSVTFNNAGTGGSGAAATAYVWPATSNYNGAPLPLAGQLMYIQITNYGTGYTAAPTVTIPTNEGGSGGTASAIAESNGQIHGYVFTNNVIIGGTASNYPAGNYCPATENGSGTNGAGFLDIAGDEYGLLPGSAYYQNGTMGVSMAALATTGGSTPFVPSDSTNSLQNYYKFNEGSGSTAHDNGLGTHENGTLNGTYTWNTTGPQGGGITFSSSNNGYVSVASFTVDPSFTFAAWVNPTTTTGTQYIASTANSAFSLYLSGGVLTATGSTGTVTGSTLTAGKWSLVSATFSGGTLTLYVNGAQVGSGSATTVTTPTSTTFYIGDSKGTGSSFNGTLDEVRYYSASLYQTMSVLGDNNLGLAGGGGYSTSTNGTSVTFSGGGGSGAAATAYADNSAGEITLFTLATNANGVQENGSGYTSAPTLSFGTNGTGAMDTLAMSVTPLSYLYGNYGPQFVYTSEGGHSVITKTTFTLASYVVTPDEAGSAATYSWSVVTWPSAASVGKPSITNYNGTNTKGLNVGEATVDLSGAGQYLFQCVATNSLNQTVTEDYPVTVVPVPSTNVAFVSPTNVTLAINGTQQFSVHGTSIANLGNTVTDQWGNAMPSSGWAWDVVPAPQNGNGSITPVGLYTAPGSNSLGNLGNVIQLKYTTADGITYLESTASVEVTDANTPSAPATVTVTPGASNSNVITWTAPPGGGETGYDVYQSTDGTYDGNIIYSSTNLSTLSFTDNSTNDPTYAPAPGGTYYYYVTAFNANGGGDPAPYPEPAGIVTGAPIAPSNLVATGGFSNSISLTWTNPATNATGVEIERSTDDSNWTQVANLAGTSSTWTDNAANDPTYGAPVNDTPYYYYVQTYNTYTSLPSDTSGPVQTISAPSGLTATAIASNQISVSWADPSGGAASFYLRYENANGGSWTTSSFSPGDTSYLLTTGLSANTQYNFEVEAYTSAGNSGYSSAVGARTWQTAATPTVYEGFNYAVGSSTNVIGQSGGIGWGTNAWAKPGSEGGTAVYEISSNSLSVTPNAFAGSTNAANTLLTTGNSFYSQDSGEAVRTLAQSLGGSGTTVWASVLVNDQSATSGGSVQLLGTGGTYNTAFGLDNGVLSMEVLSLSGIKGTTAPVEGDTYLLVLEIEYDVSGSSSTLNMWVDPDPTQVGSWGTPYATYTTTASLNNITSVEINGANSGQTEENYWDEVRLGSTAASVVPTTLPAIPTGLTATPGTSAISLSWNSASSTTSFVQGYDIWRSTNGGTSYTEYASVGSSTLSYTDTGVTAGSTYYYEVTAENTTGDSVNSTVANATYNPLPAAPSALVATPGTSTIALTWTDPSNTSNVTGYHVWRSTDNATWGSVYATVTGATATSYTDSSPTSGTGYFYKITSYNSAGDSTTAAGMTCAVATVQAYEGFNYATSSTWTGANTTGLGFTGNWNVTTSTNAAIVSGLTYSSGTSGLTTSGNALKLVAPNTATQTLSQSVGTAGSTLWVSLLLSNSVNSSGLLAGLQIGTTSTGYAAFGVDNGKIEELIYVNGTEYTPGNYTLTTGTTYFLVGEIQYLGSSPVVTMYVDPTPADGTTPTGEVDTITKTLSSTLSSTTAVSIVTNNGPNDVTTFDEIRLGSTYASVAPDPKVVVNSESHQRKRTPFRASASSDSSDLVTKVVNPGAYNFYPNSGAWQFSGSGPNDLLLGSLSGNNGWVGLFN